MFARNLTGQCIGDYLLEERIGRGGMASVYRAQQVSARRRVALKILDLEAAEAREEFSQRFAQEARIIGQIEHLHILPIYSYGIIEDQYAYIAMRLAAQGSLAERLRQKPLTIDQSIMLFVQVARALGYAHSHGIIHRDIKPSNVLLDDVGFAFLTDFGLATLLYDAARLTRTNVLIGTPAYVSPELVRGQPATLRSDVYSMGILLYHMLAGKPPFEQGSGGVMQLLYQQVQAEPQPIRSINPNVPQALEAVILRALSKDPNDRYEDAESLADAVEDAMQSATLTIHRGTSRRSPVRTWAVLAVTALVAAAALALGFRELYTAPRVVDGGVGTLSDVSLTPAEVARAALRLGLRGSFIAYVVCTADSLPLITGAREVGDLAARDNLPMRVYDSQNDATTQAVVLRQALQDGAGAIVLCPLDLTALQEAIAEVEAAGIPLVYLSDVPGDYGSKLDALNREIGYRLGLTASLLINSRYGGLGTAVAIYPTQYPATQARYDGIREALATYAPDLTWLPSIDAGTQDAAAAAVSDLLAHGAPPQFILAASDVMAYGAVEALAAAGVDPRETAVYGVNADPRALDYIRDGYYMQASVQLDRAAGSELVYRAIVKQLAGSPVPETLRYGPLQVITRRLLEQQNPNDTRSSERNS